MELSKNSLSRAHNPSFPSQLHHSCTRINHQINWFGTEDGLNNYDGYTFTIYKYDPENHIGLNNN